MISNAIRSSVGGFSPRKHVYYVAVLAFAVGVNLTYLNSFPVVGRIALIAKGVSCALLALDYLLSFGDKPVVIKKTLAIIVAGISVYFTQSTYLAMSIVLFVFGIGRSIRPIASSFFYSGILTLVVGCWSYYFSAADSIEYLRESGFMRLTLGFIHPNALGACVLSIVLSGMVLFKEKSLVRVALSSVVIASLLIAISDSRTAASLILVLPIFVLLSRSCDSCSRIYKKLLPFMVCFAVFGSLLMMVIFDRGNQALAFIDSLLSRRVSYSNGYWLDYGTSLFGADVSACVSFLGQSDFIVDNTYCHLFLKYGLLGAILFCGTLILASIRISSCDNSDPKTFTMYLAIFTVLIVYSVLESRVISFEFLWILLPAFFPKMAVNPTSE